jgi:predicted nucleic acid-binding protein
MRPVFADTSYYLALVNPDDPEHARAVRWGRRQRPAVVVSEFVLLELGNSMSRGPDRDVFLRLLDLVRNDEHTRVIAASTELFERARRLYARRPDQSWSLTDCSSFDVMTTLNITDALTTDHHFEQAGFVRLLKP